MMINGKQYSKVELVFAVHGLYYRVNTYACNESSLTETESLIELFPSMQFAQFADMIYMVEKKEFIKFRYEPKKQPVYRRFFEQAELKRITLAELKEIIEQTYEIKLHIWNKEKWEIFATLE